MPEPGKKRLLPIVEEEYESSDEDEDRVSSPAQLSGAREEQRPPFVSRTFNPGAMDRGFLSESRTTGNERASLYPSSEQQPEAYSGGDSGAGGRDDPNDDASEHSDAGSDDSPSPSPFSKAKGSVTEFYKEHQKVIKGVGVSIAAGLALGLLAGLTAVLPPLGLAFVAAIVVWSAIGVVGSGALAVSYYGLKGCSKGSGGSFFSNQSSKNDGNNPSLSHYAANSTVKPADPTGEHYSSDAAQTAQTESGYTLSPGCAHQ